MMVAATQYEANNRDAQIAQGPSIIALAEQLIAKGADLDARSRHGVTAAMIAAGFNNAAMIGLLAKAGADLTLTDEAGRTAIDVARTPTRTPRSRRSPSSRRSRDHGSIR